MVCVRGEPHFAGGEFQREAGRVLLGRKDDDIPRADARLGKVEHGLGADGAVQAEHDGAVAGDLRVDEVGADAERHRAVADEDDLFPLRALQAVDHMCQFPVVGLVVPRRGPEYAAEQGERHGRKKYRGQRRRQDGSDDTDALFHAHFASRSSATRAGRPHETALCAVGAPERNGSLCGRGAYER